MANRLQYFYTHYFKTYFECAGAHMGEVSDFDSLVTPAFQYPFLDRVWKYIWHCEVFRAWRARSEYDDESAHLFH